MFRNKAFLAIFAVFLFFCNPQISFADQNLEQNNQYPDYSCEFCGKDKCQNFNRKLFVFNLKLNRYILRPLNIGWASIVPNYGIERFQNFYNNINYPQRLVSCLLQKDFKGSKQETARFFTNMTLGVAGFYDPALNKFKIQPRQEDMGQVLAHYKVKEGPYLVLPVVRGNIRDLVGQLLDYPLKPFSYIPIAGGIANAVFSINNTTNTQPLYKKIDENYADPYEIAKQIDGFTRYIKNQNLDRPEVFGEKTSTQNIIKVRNEAVCPNLKCDVNLVDYHPQSPLIDSLRTSMFTDPEAKKSRWSTMSVWNRTFEKKIKFSSVNIDPKRPNYKYRYILQKSKTSPLAIIYPSLGEGINSEHSTILASILYKEGYSVIIQGSAFHWEFVKSMPEGYSPGLPSQDADYLRQVSAKIIASLESKKQMNFEKRIIVGTSFGAMTGLFTVAQDKDNVLKIAKCISVNPPIELFFALRQLDKNCCDWKKNSSDIKMMAAITAEKVVNVYQSYDNGSAKIVQDGFPFTDDEAKLIIGFIMKQKLSDVVFAVENCSRCKKTDVYDSVNKMSFYDYSQKYLPLNRYSNHDEFIYDTSMYSISSFLQQRQKYKIYHAADDFFTNYDQLRWLKKQAGDKMVLYNNGSHLGFLYRKEFLDDFKKEIKFADELPAKQL